MGPLDFSEITTKSTLHLPPPSLPASSAAGAERRRPPPRRAAGQLLLPHRPTRHPSDTLDPLPLALDFSSPRHATPTSSASATSPSPWTAHCRASAPQRMRASVPGAIPFHFPLLASPAPCPETPEHHRRPPERRRARSSPSPRTSRPPPPALTPLIAPPCPRAAHRPLLVTYSPPEQPRRRFPSSDHRRSPSTTHLRPPPPGPDPTRR